MLGVRTRKRGVLGWKILLVAGVAVVITSTTVTVSSAVAAGWTGTVEVIAEEKIVDEDDPNPENPLYFSKSVSELTTWYFKGNATVVKDGQGREAVWQQAVQYESSILGYLLRDDVCDYPYYNENYKSSMVGPRSGTARIIFGYPQPTPEPEALPVEVEVTNPDPLRFSTTTTCGDDPPSEQISLRTPCRVTLGEQEPESAGGGPHPFPVFPERYDLKTIYDYYEADPSGALCISSYTKATVEVQLTRLPDDDCDGIPNGQDTAADGPCVPAPQGTSTSAKKKKKKKCKKKSKAGATAKKCKKKKKKKK